MFEPVREDVASKLFTLRSKQCRSPESSMSTAGSADDRFCGARSCNLKICSVSARRTIENTFTMKPGVGGY